MKTDLPYVIGRPNKNPRYYYFRSGVDSKGRGGKLVPIPGRPGTREFSDRYEQMLAEHAPKVLRAQRGHEPKGTLGWVIQKFCAPDNAEWTKLESSTQAVYRRHFDWLREHFGDVLLASFDKPMIRRIRDVRKEHPSVANMTVDKIGQLWAWAEEYADLALPGSNPARQVAPLKYESEASPAWTPELCTLFESCNHLRMVTFYFLARYSGQRKGDCCVMRWGDYDGSHIHVVQEKTGTKLWVPAHVRLRNFLAALPRESDFILTSPRGGAYRKTSVTNLVCNITAELGFKGYSPHGLRHLGGGSLAEAGCSVPQIMAILGHLTERQAQSSVVPFSGTLIEQNTAELENRTGKTGAK
jgi:integrase